jgi:hypothetical protein
MNFPDADSGTTAWGLLVADTETVLPASFALALRETDAVVAWLGVTSETSAQIYRGLLEDLRGDLLTPGEPGHLLSGRPVWRNREDTASALTGLPAVEGVDQVEA